MWLSTTTAVAPVVHPNWRLAGLRSPIKSAPACCWSFQHILPARRCVCEYFSGSWSSCRRPNGRSGRLGP